MKARSFGIVLLFVVLVASCSSCTSKYTCDWSSVESIRIITLNEYLTGQYMYDFDVLCEIKNEEIKDFVKQLNKIDCSINRGEPLLLNSGYTVVMIDYKNGDFDLLHYSAQWLKRADNVRYGFYYFDEIQFTALVSSYL